MKTFDTIYILDLHGNKRTNEQPPDGRTDENVFNIQQGVAISIFVKHAAEKRERTSVHHADRWGKQDDKYSWLEANTTDTTNWTKLKPASPNYLLLPYNESVMEEYERYWKITDIFRSKVSGIVTSRDEMVIDFEPEPILERVNRFRDSTESSEQLREQLSINMSNEEDISRARESLRVEQDLEKYIQPILHFPFDRRFIFYHDALVERTRKRRDETSPRWSKCSTVCW